MLLCPVRASQLTRHSDIISIDSVSLGRDCVFGQLMAGCACETRLEMVIVANPFGTTNGNVITSLHCDVV